MLAMKSQIQAAHDLVDRRQNDAALKMIDDLLSNLTPPNRVEIPADRPTLSDWLHKAQRGLTGEPEICLPRPSCVAPWPWFIKMSLAGKASPPALNVE
jgi:hypothetical protein